MIDREKVMWSLARCSCGVPDACNDCYYDNWPPRVCVQHLTNDALALLQAQKPLEPIYELGITRCGQCNHEIDKYGGDNYCPQCGRAVKWNA